MHIYGYSYGGQIAAWLSDVLETELDLVVFDNSFETRRVKDINEAGCEPRDEDCVIYEDSAPFMLVSQATLDDLNTRVADSGKQFTMRSFRPNFVVKNCDAFVEVKINSFYYHLCIISIMFTFYFRTIGRK